MDASGHQPGGDSPVLGLRGASSALRADPPPGPSRRPEREENTDELKNGGIGRRPGNATLPTAVCSSGSTTAPNGGGSPFCLPTNRRNRWSNRSAVHALVRLADRRAKGYE